MIKEYESYHFAAKIRDSDGEKIERWFREKNIDRKSDLYKIIVSLGIKALETEDINTDILSRDGVIEILKKLDGRLQPTDWQNLSEFCHNRAKFYSLSKTPHMLKV